MIYHFVCPSNIFINRMLGLLLASFRCDTEFIVHDDGSLRVQHMQTPRYDRDVIMLVERICRYGFDPIRRGILREMSKSSLSK
jgi:hypothetical protein